MEKLALTHFSSRYTDSSERIEEEAHSCFDEAIIADIFAVGSFGFLDPI